MIQIRPVSDLRNKFPDVEKAVACGEPVYLTKNGYGAMVVLSLEAYSRLTDGVETALDVADKLAEEDDKRYTHEEVFSNLRRRINGQNKIYVKNFVIYYVVIGDGRDDKIVEVRRFLYNKQDATHLVQNEVGIFHGRGTCVHDSS